MRAKKPSTKPKTITSCAATIVSVMMAPTEPQVAGSTVLVRFEVTLGERGLTDGGSIQLRWENWRAGREFRFGNMRVTCGRQDAVFDVARERVAIP